MEQLGLLKSKGFFAAGYNYFNLDDGVFISRNATDGNRLVVSTSQFPSGFRHLVNFLYIPATIS